MSPRTTPIPPKVSISAAAESLSVSTRTVRRWISDGRLPAYRVGPHLIRLDQADIAALDRRIPTAGGDAA